MRTTFIRFTCNKSNHNTTSFWHELSDIVINKKYKDSSVTERGHMGHWDQDGKNVGQMSLFDLKSEAGDYGKINNLK